MNTPSQKKPIPQPQAPAPKATVEASATIHQPPPQASEAPRAAGASGVKSYEAEGGLNAEALKIALATDKSGVVRMLWEDNSRLPEDRLKGAMLREVFKGDSAIWLHEKGHHADECALFGIIEVHGDEYTRLDAASQVVSEWLDNRRAWHDRVLAVNVKVRQLILPDDLHQKYYALPEDEQNAMFIAIQEATWEVWNFQFKALMNHPNARIASTGRSDGWAVPMAPLRRGFTREFMEDSFEVIKNAKADLDAHPGAKLDADVGNEALDSARTILKLKQIQCAIERIVANADQVWADFVRQQFEGEADTTVVMPPLKDHYTLAELEAMPTISQGHYENWKYDDGVTRMGLSRMTVADGMPYNNQVTVEKYDQKTGRYQIVKQYQAR